MVQRYNQCDWCGGEYSPNDIMKKADGGEYVRYSDYEKLKSNHEKLEEALAWLLEEYHFFSRKMTEINNVVQPLWGETRERRADYQLIEDFIEQIKEKGLEQALEAGKKE